MILPNLGWGTRVTVRTTIVLFMLLETTSPVRVLREPRVTDAGDGDATAAVCDCSPRPTGTEKGRFSSAINLLFLSLFHTLGERRLNAGNIAPQQTQSAWLLELPALLLQTQMQTLLAQITSFGQQLISAQLNYFFHFHGLSDGVLRNSDVVSGQKFRADWKLISREPERLTRH